MPTPTQEQIVEALKKVKFPGLSRDIVSFNFVHDIKIDGSEVSLVIRFQSENPQVGQQIAREAEAAVRAVPGVTEARITIDVAARQQPAAMAGAGAQVLPGATYKIAVASGKGGVGKATVATNLALALRPLGYPLRLLDADIHAPAQQ